MPEGRMCLTRPTVFHGNTGLNSTNQATFGRVALGKIARHADSTAHATNHKALLVQKITMNLLNDMLPSVSCKVMLIGKT